MPRELSPDSTDFRTIYERLTAHVRELVNSTSPDGEPMLLDANVADASCLGVSEAAILAIEDDSTFVTNCYMVFLNRVPRSSEVTVSVGRLSGEPDGRRALLARIIASDEYLVRGIRVPIVTP